MAKDEKERQIQKMMQQRHANRTARKEQRMLERAQKEAERGQQSRSIDDSNIGVSRPAINIEGLQRKEEVANGGVQAEAGGPLRNEPYAAPVQNPVWAQQQQNPYGFAPQEPAAPYNDVNAANAAGAAQAAKEAEAEKQLQQQTAVRNYDDLYSTLMQQQMEQYNKDAEALARRRRSQEAIGSIADAAGAVANLIATNNYAPNQQVQPTMSAKARERYDRARADLDKSNAQQMAYLNALESQRRADRAADIQNRGLDIQEKAYGLKEDKNKLEWEKHLHKVAMDEEQLALKKAKFDLDEMYKNKMIDINQYNAISHRISANSSAKRTANGMTEYTVSEIYERDARGRIIAKTKKRTIDGKEYETTEVVAEAPESNGGSTSQSNGRSTANLGNTNSGKTTAKL